MNIPSNYTFGDNSTAARRLQLLAAAFEQSSIDLLQQRAGKPRTALDLGCGPGVTTRLVHEVTGAEQSVGIERSAHFVVAARGSTPEASRISFVQHDLEIAPYPVPPAELVHLRFLLTHLSDPGGGLLRFGHLLVPGGRLIAQEVASLHSAHPTFRRYYQLVAQLQAHHGQCLNVGRDLSELSQQTPLRIEHYGTRKLQIPSVIMAELHALNIATWRQEPFVQENFACSEIDELHGTLLEVVRGRIEAEAIDVTLGELVLVAR